MNWQKFYSLENLIQKGRQLSENCDVITFDLFDTLFIRRIHDPDLVKLPTARYIAARTHQFGLDLSWRKIQKIRDRTEQNQRRETGLTFEDQEACYPVFMKKSLEEIFGEYYTDQLLDDVTSYELEMESRMLVPRKKLVDWLAALHESGKKIYIISDIYLPSEHLKKLVDKAGFLQYTDDLVSSADTFLAKASGKAFPLVQKRFDLDKSSWLHIGDNPFSDGLRPAQFGIQALVLHDGSEKHRKALIKRYVNYSKGNMFYRGRALQQLMLPHEGENAPQTALYTEGYNFLGPMIGAFVQHIAEECRRLDITKVFFLSREGYTFKKVWEQCTPLLFPDGQLPEIEYLYVSRMALAGASCADDGLTGTSVSIAFLPPGNRDFRDIARIFQFDLNSLQPHLERYNLTPETCLVPRHEGFEKINRLRLMELINDELFQQEIKHQCNPANRALIRYLEDLQFFDHEQVAIVDIGWLGTIQRFFYNAIKSRDNCPRLHGFLFGATRGVKYPEDLKNSIQGVLYDRDRFDLAASTILYARDVFEEACRAPHPTLDGYELAEDGYKLKFRREDDETGRAEKEQDAHYETLQQGIVDAAARFGAASALLGFSLNDYRPWFNYLMAAKLAFPKCSEITAIRHKHHLDDFHGNHTPQAIKDMGPKQLWNASRFSLYFSPFLRLRYFWRHVKDVLRN